MLFVFKLIFSMYIYFQYYSNGNIGENIVVMFIILSFCFISTLIVSAIIPQKTKEVELSSHEVLDFNKTDSNKFSLKKSSVYDLSIGTYQHYYEYNYIDKNGNVKNESVDVDKCEIVKVDDDSEMPIVKISVIDRVKHWSNSILFFESYNKYKFYIPKSNLYENY